MPGGLFLFVDTTKWAGAAQLFRFVWFGGPRVGSEMRAS